jgi:hypothetical protein
METGSSKLFTHMKIDLYNNHEQYVKEKRQNWNIGRWLQSHGVTVADLDRHKQISDITLLINIRQQLWTQMTRNEQSVWGAYWNVVYKDSKPLNAKALKKFENIAEQINQRELKINILRKTNQLKLGSAIQNIDQDNKAKGSCLPPVTNTKREQQECREVPKRVWEAHELWW